MVFHWGVDFVALDVDETYTPQLALQIFGVNTKLTAGKMLQLLSLFRGCHRATGMQLT